MSSTDKQYVVVVECKRTVESVSPVGRLKSNYDQWGNVSDDRYILDVVRNGYNIPFKVLPEVACIRNN